jgi:cytochrome c peroxidase
MGCWPAPETTENMNKSKVGNLGLSNEEEDALVAFLQTLTDGFTHAEQK